ncbi:MAG: hypothetical protein AABX16_01255 [Nanoarchaeota archaeon]
MRNKISKKGQLKIQVLKNHGFLGPSFLNKKSQLKIQEMAFMLLAVFLFFALVGVFVLTIFYSNLQNEATRIAEERTASAVANIADTPELSCAISKTNCVDADKLVALLNKKEYEKFWPFSSIKIITYKGLGKKEKDLVSCTIANYPTCELFTIYDKNILNERTSGSFVVLCRKEYQNEYVYDRCELAKIIAGTELKNAG